MRKVMSTLILAVQSLIGAAAVAAPCQLSELDTYVGLGSAGCEVGSVSFSDFGRLPPPSGSAQFKSGFVVPIMLGASTVGLDFQVDATALSGAFFDDVISYRVTGRGASVNGASLSISGSTSTGDGAVTTGENLCLDGLFMGADGVTGCTGTPRDLIVSDIGIADPPMSIAFVPVASLAVVTDIGVDAGTFGTAALATASNRFLLAPEAMPEPAPMLLMGAGLLSLFGYRAARRALASRLR